MIKLEKMNGTIFFLNPHLIERLEERPDTVITMDSQTQYIVTEKVEDILKKIVKYRKSIFIDGQE